MTIFHCLAVLGPVVARAPQGLEGNEALSSHASHPSIAVALRQEEECRAVLESHPTRDSVFFGRGSGFGFDKTPYCSYACRNNIHIMFTGEVAEWP
eukprot:gene7426-559_t